MGRTAKVTSPRGGQPAQNTVRALYHQASWPHNKTQTGKPRGVSSRGPTQQTQTYTDRRARAVFYLRCFPSLINNARMRSKAGRSRKGDLKVYSNNDTHTNTHPVPANLITPEGIYLADTSFTLFQSANKNIFHVRVDARAPKPLIYVENQSEAGVLSEPNGFANCCRQTLIRLQTNP